MALPWFGIDPELSSLLPIDCDVESRLFQDSLKSFIEGSGHGNGVKSCGKPYKCFSLKFCYYTGKVAWPFHFLFLHTSSWWLLPAFPPYPDPTYHTRQRLRCCAHTGSVELSTAQHGSSNPDGHNDAKILNPSL